MQTRPFLTLAHLAAVLLLLIAGCGEDQVRQHAAEQYPEKLSAWGLIKKRDDALVLHPSTTVYDLNTALFSDYAHKLRTVYIPEGQAATYHPVDTFEFPVGSIISKTFFYRLDAKTAVMTDATWSGDPSDIDTRKHHLVETRLLVKQADGWDALPYVWSGDDAYLTLTGDLQQLSLASGETLNYLVPSKNQCASCHATNHTNGQLLPIGPKARHLNRPHPASGENQLDQWQHNGLLRKAVLPFPANASMQDTNASLAHRARSYLDINCGHCHNANGAADTSGLLLDYADHPADKMGLCKPPIAAGSGSGGRLYSIVPGHANQSILSFRLNTTKPAAMMPELGRALVHTQGVELVDAWINSLSGECL